LIALSVSLAAAQTPTSLSGAITDPSGAAIAGATVQLRGAAGEKRSKTGKAGRYSFTSLAPGKYQVLISATGFSSTRQAIVIGGAATLDVQLPIEVLRNAVKVSEGGNRVSVNPDSNGGAVVMRQRHIAALSDDPDELALQLQALAGPAPGPNGGQVFIDGFTAGSNLPPKSAIREIRINANPFSAEYDRPGFGRIEIFTKPGAEAFHGQAFAQYNGGFLDSRNPLLAQSGAPPFHAQLYGVNVSGPLLRNKASFTLDAELRLTEDDAFVLATTLDATLAQMKLNRTLPAPQTRTAVNPRIDYAINGKNTLTVRYQEVRNALDNQGVGGFNLPSRAYNERQSENVVQVTETAAISARAANETRFQFLRADDRDTANAAAPGIDVMGAFFGGGATVGNSRTATDSWELTNLSTYIRGKHTWKWGGRVRYSGLTDASLSDFAGTFTFYTLQQYAQALTQAAYPSQFSLNAGTPATRVPQTDVGMFFNDDWHIRANLTVSCGLRYEAQTNIGDRRDWAPRFALAWRLDAAKTVLRAGFGTFYDRIPATVTLNSIRYNGVTQQSYLILDPRFFPAVPSPADLQGSAQPQELQSVYSGIQAPRLYQASIGIERQWNAAARTAVSWIGSRGVHLLNSRNINAPVDGAYPFGDESIRLLTESAGLSSQNQLMVQTNVNAKGATLFGSYTLSYGADDNEGAPANPYDLRAEWGPSSYGAIRHRLASGGSVAAPWGFSVSPFLIVNSGMPYNITTGLDPGDTGFPAARPALLAGIAAGACNGANLVYAAAFGCFDLLPPPGMAVIGRNFATGPPAVNIGLRIAHTWAFGGYNVTLSAFTMNALNHANFATPEGDLSSPYFGQPLALGGLIVMAHGGAAGTYNRKIDLQLRFTF
jgi:hypothetical protein